MGLRSDTSDLTALEMVVAFHEKSHVDGLDLERQFRLDFLLKVGYGLLEEVVSDALQDVWLRLWERRETFRNETVFKTYLFRAFHNTLLNRIKRQSVEQEFANREMLSGEPLEDDISSRMIEAEVYQMVNDAFEELSTPCRRVYSASLEGKSQKEIAAQYDITINTVKKHINNANHYLRDRLRRFLGLPEKGEET